MKQTIYTLLLLTTIGFMGCRKANTDPDIKQYDEAQIQAYISTNALTGMSKDTSGMYYKIITPGTGAALKYTDSVSFVYTIHSFDGKYISSDTIANHYNGYVGHISSGGFPEGLQTAIYSLLKNKGGSMRLLVPSHLAYGTAGAGSGSSSVTNSKINGNQCLEYYIHTINNQNAYDDQVIKNWMAAKGVTSAYTKLPSGLYYKIITPGAGTVPITDNSTIVATYSNFLLNGVLFSEFNTAGGTSIDVPDLITGIQEGLKTVATSGANISFLLPSRLAYGSKAAQAIPANSCVQYEIKILDISQ
jgi:FKBP-type peptidyl-prolyl cis-trans isomerase FkpA